MSRAERLIAQRRQTVFVQYLGENSIFLTKEVWGGGGLQVEDVVNHALGQPSFERGTEMSDTAGDLG